VTLCVASSARVRQIANAARRTASSRAAPIEADAPQGARGLVGREDRLAIGVSEIEARRDVQQVAEERVRANDRLAADQRSLGVLERPLEGGRRHRVTAVLLEAREAHALLRMLEAQEARRVLALDGEEGLVVRHAHDIGLQHGVVVRRIGRLHGGRPVVAAELEVLLGIDGQFDTHVVVLAELVGEQRSRERHG